eukprot:8547840-Pyramimonas_sp.AAC.1
MFRASASGAGARATSCKPRALHPRKGRQLWKHRGRPWCFARLSSPPGGLGRAGAPPRRRAARGR